jgi:FkbM family methyltransferase
MPRTKQSKPSYDLQALLSRTEVVQTEVGIMRFFVSDSQRCDESLDQDTQGESALALMLSGLQPGDTVYDVGCRSGLHSLAFAKAVGPKGMVMCFEHDLFQLFLAHINLTDHGLDACAHFLPIVASDQFGLRRYNRFDLDNNDLDPRNGIDDLSGSGQCIAMPLDQLGDQKSPQLIRIGPMGLELAALKGMQRLIEDAQPRLFVSPESPNSHDEIALYLSQIGYDVYGFSPRFKSKSRAKAAPDGQQLDPQDFNLYCVLPRIHRAPPRLPLLMRAQAMNFRSQLVIAEDRESSGPYFEVEVDADNTKEVANAHFAYWAWQSLRNELRNFVRTFLQSALGQLSPEVYGELTRQAVEFISCETPAREYESLRSLLFQAIKSIRRAVDQGRKQGEELGALEEKLLFQAGELSKFSYQLTQASIAKSNSDIEIESVLKEKEGLYAQTIHLQQYVSELTSQLLLAKETEAKSHEILATTNARGAAELMSVSKAHKLEIGHLESKIAGLEGEKATAAAAMEAKEQEALAALALANEQASQIKQLELQLFETQEHGTLALRAREEVDEKLRQKEAEFEGAKAGFDVEVKKLLQDQNEIILRERASEDKITNLNKALDTELQEKASILSLCSELEGRISELTNELTTLRDHQANLAQEHETLILQTRKELDEALRQKEAEFESAKAGFALEVANLLQEQNEIILRGRAAEDKIANLNKALDTELQEKASILSLCSELNGRVSELTNELEVLRERETDLVQKHETLVLQAREELDDALRQKEAEFEGAKAGFDFEVTKLLQDQNEIILRGRAAEDKITDLNKALDAEIQEKASIQSLCSELNAQISELANELATLRQRETDLVQEHEALILQAREEVDEALRQKEAELESAKAGFDFEVTKFLQDQNEIILRGRAAEDKITDLNKALDAEIQEKASIQSLCSELDGRVSALTSELATSRERESNLVKEHEILILQARKELDEALRKKEAEFESTKAAFDDEVTKLLQEMNEIILRGQATEDKVTDLNKALDTQIKEKNSIQSLCSELDGRISELTSELAILRSREPVLMKAQQDLELAKVSNQDLTEEVSFLKSRIQEIDLLAEKNLVELKQQFSAHVPPQQHQALMLQTEELRRRIGAMDAELEARDMMVSDLTDLVRLQAAQLEHQSN